MNLGKKPVCSKIKHYHVGNGFLGKSIIQFQTNNKYNYKDMLKKVLTLLSLCGCLVCANAKKQYMTIEQKSGEKYSFLLDENPEISYSEGNLVVTGNTVTSFAISSVKNYHFTETASSVDTKKSNELRIINLDESTIEVQNANASAKVMLANANGAIVLESTTDADGSVIVVLPEQKGVYMLSVGAHSIKVIRK